jgi:hypothetical protein
MGNILVETLSLLQQRLQPLNTDSWLEVLLAFQDNLFADDVVAFAASVALQQGQKIDWRIVSTNPLGLLQQRPFVDVAAVQQASLQLQHSQLDLQLHSQCSAYASSNAAKVLLNFGTFSHNSCLQQSNYKCKDAAVEKQKMQQRLRQLPLPADVDAAVVVADDDAVALVVVDDAASLQKQQLQVDLRKQQQRQTGGRRKRKGFSDGHIEHIQQGRFLRKASFQQLLLILEEH